jgi:tryptophan 2,3-dioxygenase
MYPSTTGILMSESNTRPVQPSIVADFSTRLNYAGYLSLPGLLDQQHPLSNPEHHDELLFIIQHQVSELWMKLLLHELSAATGHLHHDRIAPALKILSRCKLIQMQLFEQWSVLETLTPSEYMEFRHVLGNASGFQSFQYRQLEFLLGNKNAATLKVFAHDPALHANLTSALNAPSLYDEFLALLARRGYNIPSQLLTRDFTQPHTRNEALVAVFREIYANARQHWEAYEMCEKLVDVEEYFQLWRFRHLKTVERIIGFRPGTGGSSGASFLRQALDLTFFPELLASRTEPAPPTDN